MAEKYVTSAAAKKAISAILKADHSSDMVSVANWADSYCHDPEGTWSKSCHFFDATRDKSLKEMYKQNCEDQCCVVSAITNNTGKKTKSIQK